MGISEQLAKAKSMEDARQAIRLYCEYVTNEKVARVKPQGWGNLNDRDDSMDDRQVKAYLFVSKFMRSCDTQELRDLLVHAFLMGGERHNFKPSKPISIGDLTKLGWTKERAFEQTVRWFVGDLARAIRASRWSLDEAEQVSRCA
jgi:hypothetical protein